jgi:hypothetical protein
MNDNNNNNITKEETDSHVLNNSEGDGCNRKELADSSSFYIIISGLAAGTTVDDVVDCLEGLLSLFTEQKLSLVATVCSYADDKIGIQSLKRQLFWPF